LIDILTTVLTKSEIGNLMEDMKIDILHSLAMQLDTLKIKRKQEEVEKSLEIFYPKCTNKYAWNECPLNNVEICGIFYKNNKISQYPSLPSLKGVCQGAKENMEKLWFINQRR